MFMRAPLRLRPPFEGVDSGLLVLMDDLCVGTGLEIGYWLDVYF